MSEMNALLAFAGVAMIAWAVVNWWWFARDHTKYQEADSLSILSNLMNGMFGAIAGLILLSESFSPQALQ
jgi:hypothetical protein